ncbi:D-alanyl-D-alanine carboxypeptidase [Streptomyces violaceus]|uniref:D-alanyl-D-alanine carboxypeptidase n=1 Tax=Streptomyces violaceus TaxID=1936 RepID=UPI002E2C18D6|nr:D-alanyl-D-alanine carboxypeptidase [Streptomyces violaceus]
MAGESPDRSKKRESSAQRTSGSASPVPEARSEASTEARDPRLAVARDAEKSSARGGVDTATRVFSVRTEDEPTDTPPDAADPKRPTDATGDAEQGAGDADVEGAAGDAGDGDSDAGADDAAAEESQEPAEAPAEGADGDSGSGEADSSDEASGSAEGGESSGSGRGDDTAGSDGRLRDADADAGKEPAESAEKNSTDGRQAAEDTEAETDAREAESADESAEAETDGQNAEDTDEPTKADADGRKAESADESAQADADARDGQEAPESSGESPDEPTDAPGAQEAAEEASEGAEASQDEDDEPEADRSATADSADAPEAEAEADADSEPGTVASEAGSKPDEDDGTASGAGSTPKTDSAADTDGEAAKPKDPRASHDSESSSKTDSTPDTDARASRPKDPRASDDDAESSPKAGADTDSSPESESGTEDEGEGEGEGEGEDEGEGEGTGKSGVDQPTAVFKAPRPAVDQPTTMLKIGGAAKDKGAPERDAERTSKFVALKPLDDPATRKPAAPAAPAPAPAPAEATAPVPTVSPERTTQQPLPPRPPLDMLAELTNTPPPPDTPLRTAVRRVKIWTPLALLLVIVFAVVQNVRPLPTPTLQLTAKDGYTFEGGKVDIPWPADGQAALDVQGIGTFGSSGEQKPVPIASVAKVMTAYVILRDHPLKSGEDGPKIGIDQAAEDQSDAGQESTVDVTKGDKISQREALESILIASANNVARLLARWDAGSEKAFVQKMNDAAKDLGMKNSTYTDPSGLNNTTVSTAVDQVKLARAAMEQPAFREVATMMSYVDYKGTKHDNWNRLVGYNDVTGIKTGTTTSALGNLVFSARKEVDGEIHRVVGAVVRQPAGGPDNTILGAALHEGDKLIRAAQGALESATILKKGDIVGYADDGLGGRTPVAVTEDVTAVGWAGLSVKLTFAADELPHTAKAGQKVGTLTVGDGSTSAVKVPVALQDDLVEPGFADKLTRIG